MTFLLIVTVVLTGCDLSVQTEICLIGCHMSLWLRAACRFFQSPLITEHEICAVCETGGKSNLTLGCGTKWVDVDVYVLRGTSFCFIVTNKLLSRVEAPQSSREIQLEPHKFVSMKPDSWNKKPPPALRFFFFFC